MFQWQMYLRAVFSLALLPSAGRDLPVAVFCKIDGLKLIHGTEECRLMIR